MTTTSRPRTTLPAESPTHTPASLRSAHSSLPRDVVFPNHCAAGAVERPNAHPTAARWGCSGSDPAAHPFDVGPAGGWGLRRAAGALVATVAGALASAFTAHREPGIAASTQHRLVKGPDGATVTPAGPAVADTTSGPAGCADPLPPYGDDLEPCPECGQYRCLHGSQEE
jgi:hypothetical protein